MSRKIVLVLASWVIIISCGRRTESAESVIDPENRVMDSANLLTETQQGDILSLLKQVEESSGSQVAVLLINTLDGKNIESYSLKIAEKLSLGRDEQKDGVLITVAYHDRKARIEVGIGLERILKDEVTNRILLDKMVPRFKEDKVYEGLYLAIDTIRILINENRKLIGVP